MTDAAGCSPRRNDPTRYVRVIAVFKMPLTLSVYPSVVLFGQIGKPRSRRGGGLISGDLQTLRALVTFFSQAETREEAAYAPLFFTPAFDFLLARTHRHALSKPARTLLLLSPTWKHTHTHTLPYSCRSTPRLSLPTELPFE